MAHIEMDDVLTSIARVRPQHGHRERVSRADGLQTPSPGDRGHVTVLELVHGGCGLIVYRATEPRPWVIDGEVMPRLAFRRPKFDRLRGRIAFVGPYAIWLVCAPSKLRSGDSGK